MKKLFILLSLVATIANAQITVTGGSSGGGGTPGGSTGDIQTNAGGGTFGGTTPGTGILTALGVNVGSAGAPVLFNGAGGTPSSLVLTNASGTVTNLTLVTPALGTPASGVATNLTGTASALNIGGSAASLSVSGQTGVVTVSGPTSTNRNKVVRDAADTILELGGSYTPTGTWTSLTMAGTWTGAPTFSGNIAFSGTPTFSNAVALGSSTATTQSAADNSTKLATTAYVDRGGFNGHAVYASGSPPTVDVGIFTIAKTGVDLKSAATTAGFTVPSGRAFIATGVSALVTAVTGAGAGTETITLKESGASGVMLATAASASGTPAVGSYYSQIAPAASGQFTQCAAGNIVNIVISASQAGSTTVTGTVFIQGFYTQ